MSDISHQRKGLGTLTQSLLRSVSRWKKTAKIVMVLGGALISALANQFSNLYPHELRWAFYATQGVAALLVFIGAVLLEAVDENAADALNRANELLGSLEEREKEIESLRNDFKWFTRLYATAGALRDIVESVIVHGPGDGVSQKNRFGAMLDVVVAEKATLFGIDSDRWNFAVYLYDPGLDELSCVACRRPIRAEEEAPHRSWKPGQGHVGAAFQMRREIVAGDTSEREARALFDSPDAGRPETDRRHYRSIASIPIRLVGEPIVGILVATSDVPQRFRLRQPDEAAMDPVEPLRILANALAFASKTTDFHCRLAEVENHEAEKE
jgi:hypothetical protein